MGASLCPCRRSLAIGLAMLLSHPGQVMARVKGGDSPGCPAHKLHHDKSAPAADAAATCSSHPDRRCADTYGCSARRPDLRCGVCDHRIRTGARGDDRACLPNFGQPGPHVFRHDRRTRGDRDRIQRRRRGTGAARHRGGPAKPGCTVERSGRGRRCHHGALPQETGCGRAARAAAIDAAVRGLCDAGVRGSERPRR